MSFRKTILSLFFYLIFFIEVLTALASSALKINDYVGDQGKNLSIPCKTNSSTFIWIKDDQQEDDMRTILENGTLVLTNLTVNDSGIYTCLVVSSESNENNLKNYSTIINLENEEVTTAGTITNTTSTTTTTTITTFSTNLNDNDSTFNININDKNNYNKYNDKDNNDSISIMTNKNLIKNNLVEFYKARVKIRTTPDGVAFLSARLSTIVGVLMWKFFPNQTGGYAVKCFTADQREIIDETNATKWERLDPSNIASNARQIELFQLKPNTTYEFRIFATNKLGPGKLVTTRATTKPEIDDNEFFRIIMRDAKNFDTRVWLIAVSVFLGVLLILSIGTSVLLCKECRETPSDDTDDDVDSLELVPNIIFNPGFCESDDQQPSPLQTKTFFYNISDSEDSDDEDKPSHWTIKRRISHFFTGNSVKRL